MPVRCYTVMMPHSCARWQSVAGSNPLLLARMGDTPAAPTVVIYGHYDVQPADEDGWDTDPFQLTGRDGYFYARGATDHKGPLLSAIFAAASVVMSTADTAHAINFVFVVEGEVRTVPTVHHVFATRACRRDRPCRDSSALGAW